MERKAGGSSDRKGEGEKARVCKGWNSKGKKKNRVEYDSDEAIERE